MKTTLFLMCFVLTVFMSAVPANAQQGASAPAYDAELAKRLGGNKNGMKNYVLAILKTGPNDGKIAGSERTEMFKGHMANIEKLAADGKLAVAGPFGKNDANFRGIFILNAATIEEAKKLVDTDPVNWF